MITKVEGFEEILGTVFPRKLISLTSFGVDKVLLQKWEMFGEASSNPAMEKFSIPVSFEIVAPGLAPVLSNGTTSVAEISDRLMQDETSIVEKNFDSTETFLVEIASTENSPYSKCWKYAFAIFLISIAVFLFRKK
ncbi:hypothetical protein [Mariniblastus fucicola]|uniref:hypothetical protein n=1 Tax=Mariniblastus fucicola TaxID=980251 RepID=UPI0011DFA247|nr:hypothetical protein [Mariniblastus fucicola]